MSKEERLELFKFLEEHNMLNEKIANFEKGEYEYNSWTAEDVERYYEYKNKIKK